jgi:hypothetical protein
MRLQLSEKGVTPGTISYCADNILVHSKGETTMPSLKETKESIKLRAEAVKEITAKRVQLANDCLGKHFDRCLKWQELRKHFDEKARYADEPKEKAEFQDMAKDAEHLHVLAQNIRESAQEQIKLIKDLDLSDDNKTLEAALKKIEAKRNETDNYYKMYTNEKKKTGVVIQKRYKEWKDRVEPKVLDKIKKAFDPDNPAGSQKAQLVVLICQLVRDYLKEKETDLP